MKTVLAWLLTILLAFLFIYVGMAKLISMPGMVQEFTQIGFGQWLRYVTGILEVSGGVGILIPGFRLWFALQIAVVMVGATITNIFILRIPALAAFNAVLMVLALIQAWLRRPITVAF